MSGTSTPRGPFDTAAQAFAAAGGLYLAIDRADPGGGMDEAVRAARLGAKVSFVTETLAAWGVELGAHDEHIARWIATMWDPETTIVVLDWIARAHQAAAGTPRVWRVEASLNLPPVDEEIDALRATELADVQIESEAFDVRLRATVTTGTKAEAAALVRELVATVPTLRADLVHNVWPLEEGTER